MKSNVIYILFVSVIFFCSKANFINEINVKALKGDSLIRLNNFYLLIPFYPDGNIKVIDRINQDLFIKYNNSKQNILHQNDFIFLGRNIADTDTTILSKQIQVSNHILEIGSIIDLKPVITTFLETNIESSKNYLPL
jgi:hypothetical protein